MCDNHPRVYTHTTAECRQGKNSGKEKVREKDIPDTTKVRFFPRTTTISSPSTPTTPRSPRDTPMTDAEKKEATCFFCQEKGHIKPDCPKYKRSKMGRTIKRANARRASIKNTSKDTTTEPLNDQA
jgi:hypothetical protein